MRDISFLTSVFYTQPETVSHRRYTSIYKLIKMSEEKVEIDKDQKEKVVIENVEEKDEDIHR